MMKIVIAGAGSYGQVYLSYIRAQKCFQIVGFIDDDVSKKGAFIEGFPVLGSIKEMALMRNLGVDGVIAPIGNNEVRTRILHQARTLHFKTPNFIHSSAIISEDAVLLANQGVYILPGSIIMPFARFDDFVMVSMGAKIAHHSHLHEGVFISTGVNLGANIDVGKNAFLGIGSTVMTGVKHVGAGSVIGAGAVVINDVPEKATMVGVPARQVSNRETVKSPRVRTTVKPV